MAWISGASGFLRLRKGSYLLITDKLTLDCTRGTRWSDQGWDSSAMRPRPQIEGGREKSGMGPALANWE